MYNNLLKMLKDEQNMHDEEFHVYSKKASVMYPVIKAISDKRGNISEQKKIAVVRSDTLYYLIWDVIGEENQVLMKEITRYNRRAERLYEKEEQLRDINNINTSLLQPNISLSEYEEIKVQGEKILDLILETYCDLYNNVVSIKEEEKDLAKKYANLIKCIISKRMLRPVDLVDLLGVIDDIEDSELKSKISSELEQFLVDVSKPNPSEKKEVTKEETIKTHYEPVKYEDDEMDEIIIEDDTDYENYYNAIKSFTRLDDVKVLFDSIKYGKDVRKIISKIIEMLEDDNNLELINYLNEYLAGLNISEDKEEVQEKATVLYNGFLSERRIVQGDLDDIPKENYDTVLTAIEKIKENKAEKQSKGIMSQRKILKLRYRNIRIFFRKLANGIYLILGIFVKKDQKGYNIVDTAKRRNTRFTLVENDLIKAINNKALWEKYIQANEEYEKEINSILKSKIKEQ